MNVPRRLNVRGLFRLRKKLCNLAAYLFGQRPIIKCLEERDEVSNVATVSTGRRFTNEFQLLD